MKRRKRESKNRFSFLMRIFLCGLVSIQFSTYSLSRVLLERTSCNFVLLFYAELLKCATSFLMMPKINFQDVSFCDMWVPTLFFLAGNALSMFCTAYVDASLFVVLMQLKLVWTAVFSRTYLKLSLDWIQILSVSIICCGCVNAVSIAPFSSSTHSWAVLGLVVETALSGFSSVYVQGSFKNSTNKMWEKNFLMSFASAICYSIICSWTGCSFLEMSVNDWILSFLGYLGGVLVALTLLFCGAIEKTISTACSVFLTIILEVWFKETFSSARFISSLVVVQAAGIYCIQKTLKPPLNQYEPPTLQNLAE